jgi:enoyl-CoA hydratase/carnithine racemase
MCDFILAGDNARFGQPEINLGVLPGMGGTQRLTRAVGKAKAMEMCLTGRFIDAVEAERCGIVARIVPADELLDEALKTAALIASKSVPASNAGCSTPRLRPRTRRKAWPHSWPSVLRNSKTSKAAHSREGSLPPWT